MRIFLYICIRKNKGTYLVKNFKNMTIILKTQTKEIETGILRIEKVLEKDSKVPYYVGTFQPKNSVFSQVIIKRFSKFSMSYLEDRI
jgi:hypothetical protein